MRKHNPEKIKNIFANLFLIQIVFVFSILLIHFIHEKFFFEKKDDITQFQSFWSDVFYKPFPYIMFKSHPNSSFPIQRDEELNQEDRDDEIINKIGYRGPVPSKNKDDTFRIFLLGGSTVFGSTASFRVPLQKFFSKNNKTNVQVYNFGVPSSVSGQELARIVFEIADYHPDLIIMYNGYNDAMSGYADPRPGYPFNFMIYENNPIGVRALNAYPLLDLILFRSSLLRNYLPEYFIQKFMKKNEIISEMEMSEAELELEKVKNYWNNIYKSALFSRALNSDFIAIFQPQLAFKKKLIRG